MRKELFMQLCKRVYKIYLKPWSEKDWLAVSCFRPGWRSVKSNI